MKNRNGFTYLPWYTGYLTVLFLFLKYLFFFFLDKKGQRNEIFTKRLLKYFEPETLDQGRKYSQRHRNLSLLGNLFFYPLTGFFIFAGWSQSIETWAQGLTGNWMLALGYYLVCTMALFTITSIPVSLYRTFVIEKEEGFNTQTLSLWLLDLLREFFLGFIFGFLVSIILLAIIQALPDSWWAWGAFALSAFSIFMAFITPWLIMPLFNKFSPLADEDLEKDMLVLAQRAGMKVKKILVMDASKRSRHSNAFFSGLGASKRIVLFDTLLEKHTKEEIISILAHEMGHWKRGHIRKSLVISTMASLIAFYLLFIIFQRQDVLSIFHIKNIASATFLISAMFLSQLASIFVGPLSAWYSRKNEKEADKEALLLYPKGQVQADTMKRLVKENRGDLLGHPLVDLLTASHPHPLERIEFALQYSKSLEDSIEINK
jgi:STE24 endopeptidase